MASSSHRHSPIASPKVLSQQRAFEKCFCLPQQEYPSLTSVLQCIGLVSTRNELSSCLHTEDHLDMPARRESKGSTSRYLFTAKGSFTTTHPRLEAAIRASNSVGRNWFVFVCVFHSPCFSHVVFGIRETDHTVDEETMYVSTRKKNNNAYIWKIMYPMRRSERKSKTTMTTRPEKRVQSERIFDAKANDNYTHPFFQILFLSNIQCIVSDGWYFLVLTFHHDPCISNPSKRRTMEKKGAERGSVMPAFPDTG